MKKDVSKLMVLGLLSGFCLAANGPSEIAMSKCSKDTSQSSSMDNKSMDEGCGSKSNSDSDCKMSAPKPEKPSKKSSDCNQDTSCDCDSDVSEEADASLLMKTHRKEI